jgi:hypothetical protein
MKTRGYSVAWGLVAVGVVLLAGCTAQPYRVSCDERLEPINAPAPRVVEVLATKLSPTPSTVAEAP